MKKGENIQKNCRHIAVCNQKKRWQICCQRFLKAAKGSICALSSLFSIFVPKNATIFSQKNYANDFGVFPLAGSFLYPSPSQLVSPNSSRLPAALAVAPVPSLITCMPCVVATAFTGMSAD